MNNRIETTTAAGPPGPHHDLLADLTPERTIIATDRPHRVSVEVMSPGAEAMEAAAPGSFPAGWAQERFEWFGALVTRRLFARLSGSAKSVVVIILWHVNRRHGAFPSVRLMGDESGSSPATVKRALKELLAARVIERRSGGGGRRTTTYHLGDASTWILPAPPATHVVRPLADSFQDFFSGEPGSSGRTAHVTPDPPRVSAHPTSHIPHPTFIDGPGSPMTPHPAHGRTLSRLTHDPPEGSPVSHITDGMEGIESNGGAALEAEHAAAVRMLVDAGFEAADAVSVAAHPHATREQVTIAIDNAALLKTRGEIRKSSRAYIIAAIAGKYRLDERLARQRRAAANKATAAQRQATETRRRRDEADRFELERRENRAIVEALDPAERKRLAAEVIADMPPLMQTTVREKDPLKNQMLLAGVAMRVKRGAESTRRST